MFREIFLNWNFLNKWMLELIIYFSSLYWISYSSWICSQTTSNSSNVVFSIKIPGNLQKMFVNNEILQKPITEKDYVFSMIIVNFYFLNLFLNNWFVYFRIFVTYFVVVIQFTILHSQFNYHTFQFTILHSQFNHHTFQVTPFQNILF